MARFDELRSLLRELTCLRCKKRVNVNRHSVVERYCGRELIKVQRVECCECKGTFRVLPEFLVPYKTHPAEQIEDALTAWKERGSCHGAAKAVGLEPKLVRRWIRWWTVVEAVVKAIKSEAIVYRSGWLRRLLLEFRYWKGRVACEP